MSEHGKVTFFLLTISLEAPEPTKSSCTTWAKPVKASSGRDALEHLLKSEIAVVLVDVHAHLAVPARRHDPRASAVPENRDDFHLRHFI